MERQIGKTRTSSDKDNVTTYTATFYVDTTAVSKYILASGTAITATHSYLTDFPLGYIIRGHRKIEAGTSFWLVTVTADNKASALPTMSTRDTMTEMSVGISPFQFDKAWFGLKLAQSEDVATGVYRFGTSEVATVGNLIFANACADDLAGYASYAAGPFTSESMTDCFGEVTSIDESLVESALSMTFKLKKFTVKYFDASSAESAFETYQGVLSSVPSGYRPSDFSSNRYLADDQTMKSVYYNGALRYVVTRSMIKAPEIDGSQLLWSAIVGTATW